MAAREADVVVLETPSLGDRSYVVHDGEVALVVDPQRDIDRVLAVAAEQDVAITHVVETHVHNDYLTGGHALAVATGAAYLVNAADDVSFERTPVRAGDVVEVGSLRVEALATPGHTFTHLAYVVTQRLGEHPDGAQERQVGVFTGGSLLYGTTGRPDLLGSDHTDELAHLQHRSARHLAEQVPDEAAVYPTHGFGSFCSSGASSGASASTLGEERRANPVLTTDEEAWVADMVAGLDVWPAYYVHMAPANEAGPEAPDLSEPERADAAQVRRRVEAGEWVVDLRNRTAFAAGHAPGTLSFGLDGSFVTYLGWLLDWGAPVTLLGETAEEVAEAQRELVRIGVDRPAAAATGGPDAWSDRPLASFPRASFADLDAVRHHREVTVLDVRMVSEHREQRIADAVSVPLHELPHRIEELPGLGVPREREVWIHCGSGYRASIAASFLVREGWRVVLVDEDFPAASGTGLPLVEGAPARDSAA